MAINKVVSVQYDGGLLPGIELLTQCYYIHRGTRHEDVLSLKPTIIIYYDSTCCAK